MIVLACDTSTVIMHLCLARFEEGELSWFSTQSLTCGTRHSELLLDRILGLCLDADITLTDIDLLVTTKGPGSFTGLRISLSLFKGISVAAGTPVVSVPSFDAWYGAIDFVPNPVLAVIDAKKQRFYAALYQDGKRIAGPVDLPVAELATLIAPYEDLVITGSDAALFIERLGSSFPIAQSEGSALALSLARLGVKQYLNHGADRPESGPLYIRKSDAEIALEKRLKEAVEENHD